MLEDLLLPEKAVYLYFSVQSTGIEPLVTVIVYYYLGSYDTKTLVEAFVLSYICEGQA